MSHNPLRQKLRSDPHATTLGFWATMECASVTEIAISLGIDFVVVEMEHGHLGFKDVMDHLRVVRGTETSILVRVPDITQDAIKRTLDMGAHGVLLPLPRSAADVESGFRFGRYPPRGIRGVGGERAVQWGLGFQEYLEIANEETMIIPLIETRGAVAQIDEILAVDGLEAIFFGPADLSADHGHLGEWEGGDLAHSILEIRSKAAERNIAAGIMSLDVQDSILRAEQGFRMVGLGSDAGMMIRALRENLTALGRDAKPHLWF